MARKVLLDTTVQIERLFYPTSQQRQVEESLLDCEVYLSSTSFREFQASILSAFDYVIGTMREIEPDLPLDRVRVRLGDIIRFVATAPMYSVRDSTRVQLIVALVASSIGPSDSANAADIVDLLEGERTRYQKWRYFTIGYWPDDYDVRESDHYLDLCGCSVASEPHDPAASAPKRVSCNRATRSCDVLRVLDDHTAIVRAAAIAVSPRKPHVPEIAERAIAASQEWAFASLGEKLCWPLGDTIIGIEALATDSELYSRDGDQALIADAIGLTQFRV